MWIACFLLLCVYSCVRVHRCVPMHACTCVQFSKDNLGCHSLGVSTFCSRQNVSLAWTFTNALDKLASEFLGSACLLPSLLLSVKYLPFYVVLRIQTQISCFAWSSYLLSPKWEICWILFLLRWKYWTVNSLPLYHLCSHHVAWCMQLAVSHTMVWMVRCLSMSSCLFNLSLKDCEDCMRCATYYILGWTTTTLHTSHTVF